MSLENELKKLTVAVQELTARLTAPDADVVSAKAAPKVSTPVAVPATPSIPTQAIPAMAMPTMPPLPTAAVVVPAQAMSASSELKFEDVQAELGKIFQLLGDGTQLQAIITKWGGADAQLNQVPAANYAGMVAEAKALVAS